MIDSSPSVSRRTRGLAGLAGALSIILVGGASAQPAVKIVGIGAVPCSEFIAETGPDPVVEKYFFAWAQGT